MKSTPRKRKFMKKGHFARKPKIARSRRGKGKPKLVPLSKLKKRLDAVCSQWTRLRYADSNGMVKSFTGTEIKHWKQMHAGHYLTRSILALRWHPDNVRPQSPAENIWKHGNPIEFRINLVAEIGEERVKDLESRRKEIFKPTRQFYEEKIAVYEKQLEDLSTPHGFP